MRGPDPVVEEARTFVAAFPDLAIDEVENGTVIREADYFDSMAMLAQLGVPVG